MRRRSYLGATAGFLTGGFAGCVRLGSDGGTSASERTATQTSTAATAGSAQWTADPVELPVSESELYRAAPRDSIPAIVEPVFDDDWSGVSYEVEKGTGGVSTLQPRLAGDDEVLGVERDGRARAYPLKVLDWHEVVNDAFGRPQVVTYCPVCRSGVVADRRVAGAVRTFGVSGFLFRANLVLYDEQSETLWGQLLAQAIRGPLTGERLSVGASTVTTWRAWRAAHPETTVLLPPPFSGTVLGDVRVNYEIDVYGRVRDIAERYPDYGPLGELEWGDTRLQRRAIVIGVVEGARAKAYPLAAVQATGPITDSVGGRPVVVALGQDRTLYAYDRTVAGMRLRFTGVDETGSGGGDSGTQDGRGVAGPMLVADGSRWRVATGEAVDGPHEGRRLESAAAGSQLYWAGWVHAHPDSELYGFE